MRTIVITNQKGGCGKTTTSLNLAAALSQMGQRVLLIDLDPQAHATLGLGCDPENPDNTIYNVITNRRFSISKAILDTKIEGLNLIPSNIRLAKVELEMTLVSQKEFILADQLKKISNKYDFCIIDCPPSLGLLTFNALVASTDIIVPVQVHYYALEGLKQLLETIKTARKRFYPCSIKILGLLLTFVEERAALSQQVEQQMKNFFNELVFKTVIHRTITLAEAPSAGEPIITYAPESRGSDEYMALAREVIASEDTKSKKEPHEISEIVEKIQITQQTIAEKPQDKQKAKAQETTTTKEKQEIAQPPKTEKARKTKRKEKEKQPYYIPERKNYAGRLIFFLLLLLVTIAVAIITIRNNPPKAKPNNINVLEDTPTQFTLEAYDRDRDDLEYKIITEPEHGLISGTAPKLTYTPNEDYIGSDSLRFIVSDGRIDSNSAEVSINVTPVNDPPVANQQTVLLKADKSFPITLTGSDKDSSNINFSINTETKNGSISKVPGFETNGKIVYTPKPGFTGIDSFTFITNDGDLNSKPAIVQINVTENNPPVANISTINTDEDTPVTIILKGEDPDGDTLTYNITSEPLHGILSGNAPNLTYTPNDNYSGPDSFNYTVNDGKNESFAANVSITINSINDAPTVKANSISTQEDTPVSITLFAADPDGDTMIFNIVSQPSHGVLSSTMPNTIYTPNNNYYGSDSFSYKASDGKNESAITSISITIEPTEDDPVAVSGNSVVLNEDTPTIITLEAIDPDGDPLTYTIERSPSRGTITGTGPEITYTPDQDFNWLDSFTFSVSDGKTKSSPAVVYITVNSVNDPPTANDDKTETYEDQSIDTIKVLANDTDLDKDPLTIKEVSQAPHGLVEINSDSITLKYTPEPNYYGIDNFTYTAQDPSGSTDTAVVEVKITPLNDSPVFVSTPVTNAILGNIYKYDVNAVDPDHGDQLTYTLISKPDGMDINVNTGVIEWTPDDINKRVNEVIVKVTDNNAISASATQSFIIEVVPTPSKIATLTVTDGYDQNGKSIFYGNQDVNVVMASDNKYLEIKPNSYIAFDLSNILLPSDTKIVSLVVFVEHYEQDSFPNEFEKWSIGEGWPGATDIWFTIDAPVHQGQTNDSMDSWDAASFVETPRKLNNLQLQIKNDDSMSSIFLDYIYVMAQWDWSEDIGLVEYNLEPVPEQ
ncbi:MAG: tandem-95 repeat protein [Sedimentisphaerales bacterium]|nr:tandem-95 repeat protein [Sedimentisphaerales bacterium]